MNALTRFTNALRRALGWPPAPSPEFVKVPVTLTALPEGMKYEPLPAAEPEYTDWFPRDVKPVHVGWYETDAEVRHIGKLTDGGCKQWWDGTKFHAYQSWHDDSVPGYASCLQHVSWRGLASPTPGVCYEIDDCPF